VLVGAARVQPGASIAAALAAVAALDFFFVHPIYTFAVADLRHLLTFGVFLGVALVVGDLTRKLRAESETAVAHARRMSALYALARELAGRRTPVSIAACAARHLEAWLQSEAVVVRANGQVLTGTLDDDDDARAVRAVLDGAPAATGRLQFVPMRGRGGVIGAFGTGRGVDSDALEALAANVAVALDRAWYAEATEAARLAIETEQTRSSLLSSVSHDLRTPLASITGAASAALESPRIGDAERRLLLATIRDEGTRLGRLIGGLHQLTSLQGVPTARTEWVPVDEVVASAVDRARDQLPERDYQITLPEAVVWAPMDPVLIDQLIFNLLDNATKYAPTGPIAVHAERREGGLWVTVSDRGPGLPPGAEARVFERFWREADGGRTAGSGLGLAIAAAICRVHQGRIFASSRDGGGATFGFYLPIPDDPPPHLDGAHV
jgi:two-component system sensor histidine kinase KdpD